MESMGRLGVDVVLTHRWSKFLPVSISQERDYYDGFCCKQGMVFNRTQPSLGTKDSNGISLSQEAGIWKRNSGISLGRFLCH